MVCHSYRSPRCIALYLDVVLRRFVRIYPHADWRVFLEALGESNARRIAAGVARAPSAAINSSLVRRFLGCIEAGACQAARCSLYTSS